MGKENDITETAKNCLDESVKFISNRYHAIQKGHILCACNFYHWLVEFIHDFPLIWPQEIIC